MTRKTKQMNVILNCIDNNFNHPTAKDIYESCKKEIPNISLATIYRNLNKLSDMGLIKRIKMPNNIDRFDHIDNHPHFICIKCGKIIDLDESFDVSKFAPKNVMITDYEINFKGICENCQRKEG